MLGSLRSYNPDRSQKRWGDSVPSFCSYKYFICHRGKIKNGKKTDKEIAQSYGTWTLDLEGGRLHLYVTCPQCAAPNDLSDHTNYISEEGRVYTLCVVCYRCTGHFFPELIGWDRKFEKRIYKKVRVKK